MIHDVKENPILPRVIYFSQCGGKIYQTRMCGQYASSFQPYWEGGELEGLWPTTVGLRPNPEGMCACKHVECAFPQHYESTQDTLLSSGQLSFSLLHLNVALFKCHWWAVGPPLWASNPILNICWSRWPWEDVVKLYCMTFNWLWPFLKPTQPQPGE